ncbi:hypothetical protein DYU11_12510 [Fibrisoma montanum]|uniref:Uncharacterized protein n=1 Tax=Fibrisoma montanum TaxID=2305895 RepID=A0A418MBT1_9BACT|nr:hypothetical protein DYU11_12510 [Fibrisoma montanum]
MAIRKKEKALFGYNAFAGIWITLPPILGGFYELLARNTTEQTVRVGSVAFRLDQPTVQVFILGKGVGREAILNHTTTGPPKTEQSRHYTTTKYK